MSNEKKAIVLLGAIVGILIPVTSLAELDFQISNPGVAVFESKLTQDTKTLTLDAGPAVNLESIIDNKFSSKSGEVSWSAEINYTIAKIFNPRTSEFDTVKLRSYQGAGVDPDVPFVAPTINLTPGETFRFTLNNKLPADDPSCKEHDIETNVPHCFNSTNMHSHGLWVSPSGNSDNVLLKINPGVEFTYEYNIPVDHPAGTFWYHPHLHGSTALQVSSGMAGALIIRGDRFPTDSLAGDIDTLLKKEDGTNYPERILLFQQIPYACRTDTNAIKQDANGNWSCDPGEVGTIESYDLFGPSAWKKSGRYTSVNGRVIPKFKTAKVGEIERWRMIHAGVRDSIKLRLQKYIADGSVTALSNVQVTDSEKEQFVDTNCASELLPQVSIAADGLTKNNLVEQDESILHPGYREDLLVAFSEPGIYCVVDGDAAPNESVNQQQKSRHILGYIEVLPSDTAGQIPNIVEYIKQRLIASAQVNMPPNVVAKVVSDLQDNNGLAAFAPHSTLVDEELDGVQTLGFFIGAGATGGTVFQVGDVDDDGDLLNPKSYDPDRMDRTLTLGTVEEWQLSSFLAGHPFHIHVNPFEIIKILDPQGNDVSGFEEGNQSPYARLKGVWKDTLFVAQTADREPYKLILRTKYRRYIGDFVLHCHILDHEDNGMMQNVRIALPDGKGGVVSAGH